MSSNYWQFYQQPICISTVFVRNSAFHVFASLQEDLEQVLLIKLHEIKFLRKVNNIRKGHSQIKLYCISLFLQFVLVSVHIVWLFQDYNLLVAEDLPNAFFISFTGNSFWLTVGSNWTVCFNVIINFPYVLILKVIRRIIKHILVLITAMICEAKNNSNI